MLRGILSLAVCLLVAACNGEKKEDGSVFDKKKTDGGGRLTDLVIKDVKVGSGKEAKAGGTVTCHYTLWLRSGRKIQSSYDNPRGPTPATFPLTRVIEGWQKGIPGMKEGGVRRLEVPARMGYSNAPPPGSGIPPDADLVFEVKLIRAH